jgi:hypothetical protein
MEEFNSISIIKYACNSSSDFVFEEIKPHPDLPQRGRPSRHWATLLEMMIDNSYID